MIITPARFEDEMKDAKTIDEAVQVMLITLESMGYGAGTRLFINKSLNGELPKMET